MNTLNVKQRMRSIIMYFMRNVLFVILNFLFIRQTLKILFYRKSNP